MELQKDVFRKDRLNAEGRKDSKGCCEHHFHSVGNTDASFPHAVEDKEGQLQEFPRILNYNLELPPTITRTKVLCLSTFWPGSL